MDVEKIWLDSIRVGPRHRTLDASKIDALAESMDTLGLQQPISVAMDDDGMAHLIAGLHRVEAAKKLDWDQIDAVVVEMSPIRREMWEIAENLFRVDLTKEQRDQHIRRYAELLGRVEAESAKEDKTEQNDAFLNVGSGRAGPGRGNKGIARRIADETGLSKSTIQRALNPPAPKPIPPPDPPHNPEEAYNKWASEMNRVFSRAPREWRDRWISEIDIPIMDSICANGSKSHQDIH